MKMSTILVQPETTISTWVIDRVHSTAQFKVKHMMISNVLGEFTSITGVLERHENDVTKSKIRASIDASTINTREPQRDAHLKSADFFHVENHPDLTFNSTSISKNADGELKVSGHLTIRGVTRNVVFDVEGLVGKYANWAFCDDADQPERLWPHLERSSGSRRPAGGRRGNHQLGRPAHQRALIKAGTERVKFDHRFN
jgi:polyisoprenoid-binding protein YceI